MGGSWGKARWLWGEVGGEGEALGVWGEVGREGEVLGADLTIKPSRMRERSTGEDDAAVLLQLTDASGDAGD